MTQRRCTLVVCVIMQLAFSRLPQGNGFSPTSAWCQLGLLNGAFCCPRHCKVCAGLNCDVVCGLTCEVNDLCCREKIVAQGSCKSSADVGCVVSSHAEPGLPDGQTCGAQEESCCMKGRVPVRWNPLHHQAHQEKFWTDWEDNSFCRRWEARSFCIFDRYVQKGSVVLDVGAWIGPTVLYLAAIASKVVALEPAPAAYKMLQGNIWANPDRQMKISALQAALGAKPGFQFFSNMGNGGDTVFNLSHTMSAESITTSRQPGASTLVPIKTIRDLLFEHPELYNVSFFKLDVEGAEAIVVPSLKLFLQLMRPITYISIHPHVLKWPEVFSTLRHLLRICPQLHFVVRHQQPTCAGLAVRPLHGLENLSFLRTLLFKDLASGKLIDFEVLCSWKPADLSGLQIQSWDDRSHCWFAPSKVKPSFNSLVCSPKRQFIDN